MSPMVRFQDIYKLLVFVEQLNLGFLVLLVFGGPIKFKPGFFAVLISNQGLQSDFMRTFLDYMKVV